VRGSRPYPSPGRSVGPKQYRLTVSATRCLRHRQRRRHICRRQFAHGDRHSHSFVNWTRERASPPTLADGENASRERLEKLFGIVLEITPIGVKSKIARIAARRQLKTFVAEEERKIEDMVPEALNPARWRSHRSHRGGDNAY
jgi:hypothetical protein